MSDYYVEQIQAIQTLVGKWPVFKGPVEPRLAATYDDLVKLAQNLFGSNLVSVNGAQIETLQMLGLLESLPCSLASIKFEHQSKATVQSYPEYRHRTCITAVSVDAQICVTVTQWFTEGQALCSWHAMGPPETLARLLQLQEAADEYFIDVNALKRQNQDNYISVVGTNFEGALEMYQCKIDRPTLDPTTLDLYYGDGFKEFHEGLLGSLTKQSKGICLLHGIPGSGKTTYIRLICYLLKLHGKQVYLFPKAMVNQIGTAAFNSFLLEELVGKESLLVLEDAEDVLCKRGAGQDNPVISNILNMTDGIMNDLFRTQIIATFNVDSKDLDPAMTRSGRLIAKKYFGLLPAAQANQLLTHLGSAKQVNCPISLADLFALDQPVLEQAVQAVKLGF